MRRVFFPMIAMAMATMLASCGGGDDASPPATDPVVSAPSEAAGPLPAPTGLAVSSGTKRFMFTWNAVPGATSYRLLEDADGTGPGAATQVGTSIAGTTSTYAPSRLLHTLLNARYSVQACDATGCSAASSPVTPDVTAAIGYFKASTAGVNSFGRAMAISADGNTLAVGAPTEDSAATGIDGDQSDGSASGAGAVYVFVRGGSGTWTQEAYVKASNTRTDQAFGSSLALSANGSTLAVGAPQEDSAATGVGGNQADTSAANAGAVYVYTRSGSSWAQQAYVKASNTDAGDMFGTDVGLSADGDLLAVGSLLERSAASGVGGNQADNSLSNAGAAYLFRRSAGAWSQEAYLKASNPRQSAFFGQKLALSADGGTLAVAGSQDPSNATGIDGDQADASAHAAGAVYVFVHGGGAWSQQAYVKASNTDANDIFGSALALSADGSTMAVAAYQEDSAATGVDGNQADNSAVSSGALYVFTRAGTAWSQQAYLKTSNTGTNDSLGWSVALSADGNTLAAGAAFEASGAAGIDGNQADNSMTFAGAAYVFARTGTAWAQAAYLKAPNPAPSVTFGRALALSGDGRTLAIGGPNEKSGATGVQGNQADTSQAGNGAVYLY